MLVITFNVQDTLDTQVDLGNYDDLGNSLADGQPWADLDCQESDLPDYM